MLKIKIYDTDLVDRINEFIETHHVLRDGIRWIQDGVKVAILYDDSYGLDKYKKLELLDGLLTHAEENLLGKRIEMEGLTEELRDKRLTKEEAEVLNKANLNLTREIKSNQYLVDVYRKKIEEISRK